MTVRHHLDDATLLRYASGDLDEAFTLIVSAHLAMCAPCRKAARTADEIGGRLLESGSEVSLSNGALDRAMECIDRGNEGFAARPSVQEIPAARGSDVPLPLQRLLGRSLDEIRWKPVAPGIRKFNIDLPSNPKSTLQALYIAAGKAVPEHGHGGSEMTLILSGAYRDALGRFGPGDIADLDEHVEHQPKVEPDAPCICLVATEAPTQFHGFFSRLLQPLVGI